MLIDNFLLKNKNKTLNTKLKFWCDFFKDYPYKINPLPIEKNNKLFYSFDYFDCTTFVITIISLSLSDNIQDFEKHYKKLLYYSNISYNNRIHFTYERIKKNIFFPDLLNNIKINNEIILNKNKLLNIDFEKKISFSYFEININKINNFLKQSKLNTGIALIKKNTFDKGYIISHEGILIDSYNFYHASKDSKKIVKINIIEYLKKDYFDGFLLFNLNV